MGLLDRLPLETFLQLLQQALADQKKAVRLLGVGVRFSDESIETCQQESLFDV